MISVLLECDADECSGGGEYVDVYHRDWENGEPVNRWLPDGWQVIGHDERGYPLVRCADCAEPPKPPSSCGHCPHAPHNGLCFVRVDPEKSPNLYCACNAGYKRPNPAMATSE